MAIQDGDDTIDRVKDEPVWICWSSGFKRGWVEFPIEHRELHYPHYKFYFYSVLTEDGESRKVPSSRLMDRDEPPEEEE